MEVLLALDQGPNTQPSDKMGILCHHAVHPALPVCPKWLYNIGPKVSNTTFRTSLDTQEEHRNVSCYEAE